MAAPVGMTKGKVGASTVRRGGRDRLLGSQVSKARPGAPFDLLAGSELVREL
jgi:hypothetical protein